MKLLLIALVCALTGCSLDTVDDTPILLRHRGGDRVDQDAGAGTGGDAPDAGQVAGSGGAQAGSGSFGGTGQGGASGAAGSPQGGSPSAGSAGANAGSAGLAPTAGMAGASGSAGLAGSAGDPAGGAPGGQGGAAEAGAAGVAGSPIDYFQGCPGNGTPGAPLWIPVSGLFPPAEYTASIPLNGQVQAYCGVFSGNPQYDRCIWTCHDQSLCGTTPPDGSANQSAANVAAWGYRPFCDCFDSNNNCANAPH